MRLTQIKILMLATDRKHNIKQIVREIDIWMDGWMDG
jgi:hypothetical protein